MAASTDTMQDTDTDRQDDGRDETEPLASAVVLRAVDDAPFPSGLQALTVEVDLPPLPRLEVSEQELAVRIDDVPVQATDFGLAAARTSSIEIAPIPTIEVPPLDARTGPYVRPIGERTTGTTPRAPMPNPRATGPVPTVSRNESPLEALLGHVPGATQEVPRLEAVDRVALEPRSSWSRVVRIASLRRPDRDRRRGA